MSEPISKTARFKARSLSLEDQRVFAEAILNPPEPTPALRRAFRRHRELIQQSPVTTGFQRATLTAADATIPAASR